MVDKNQFQKEFLLGENLFNDDELKGLDLGRLGGFESLVNIEEEDVEESNKMNDRKKPVIKKKLGSHHPKGDIQVLGGEHQDASISQKQNIGEEHPSVLNEQDLNLKLICVHEGEMIYKLSDLFIPKDERIVKKIEKYINKLMTLSEKEKPEKENEDKKKEISDEEEIVNLIKKSKRNQKYTKINITHNEKFFDRTFFLENIKSDKEKDKDKDKENTLKINPMHASLNNNAKDISKTVQPPEQENKNKNKNKISSQSQSQSQSSLEDNVERNLLNSLFFLQMKLKHDKLTNETFDKNNIQDEQLFSSLTNKQNNSLVEFEENEIISFNQELKKKIEKNTTVENVECGGEIEKEPGKVGQNTSASFLFNDTFAKKKNNMRSSPLNSSEIFLSNKEFKNFSLNNSEIISEFLVKNNVISPAKDELQIPERKKAKMNLEFKHEKEKIDLCDLYDMTKRKRHRADGYINIAMLNGDFSKSLLLDGKNINPNYSDISKIIFDINDYNMNFEILPMEVIEKKAKEKEANVNNVSNIANQSVQSNPGQYPGNMNGLLPNTNSDEFFNMLVWNKNNNNSFNNSQQNVLKIGKSKGNLLTHAKCAYNLTYNKINLTYEDLKDFHRPNFCKYLLKEKKKRNFSITISEMFNISKGDRHKKWDCTLLTRNYLRKKEKKRISKNIQYMNAYEIFKDRSKLSLIDGKFCLFEHLDENPLFISNFGMASKMKKFLYSPKLFNINVSNPNTKLSESELKTYNIIGPHGSQILLQPNQKLPLIGQIDQTELKGLTVVDNKMFRAPLIYEKIKTETSTMNSNSKHNTRFNFLITFKKSKNGKESFYIRELAHHYVVAQEEPKIEVYPPQSRQYNNFLKNKIKTYTYKLYNEIGYKAGINFKVFTNLFPTVTEQVLKKNFREMNIEIDKNICYFTKIPSEDNQNLITPENICQFESCQFGIYKLRDVGIKNLTNADKISYATNKFIHQTPELKQQYLAKVIEEELLTTPWNITQNFLQAKQIKGMLAIKGIGDPSNGNGGYSFLKMPVKTYNDNKTLKEEMDILKNQNKNIKTVTGTDADLRKLSKEDIKLKLIQLGEDEEYIKKLSRWERVSLLRYKSSKAAELGYEGDITKYARGMRMNSKVQRDAYQKNINDVFKKQIDYITNEGMNVDNDEYVDEESSEGEPMDNEDFEKNEEEAEIDDKKRGMGFMRNEIFPNKKKKKADSVIKRETNGVGKKNDNKIIKIYNKNQNSVEDQNTKIKLDMKNLDLEFLKRKHKGSKFDNIYEYEMDKNATFTRKRRDTPEKMFNELIEDIIDSCIRFDSTKLFHQPVKKKEYQDYYDIIKHSIDLGSMKNKTKRNEYTRAEQFISDMELMVNNSMIYNGETHDVTSHARKIKDLAVNKINESSEKLKELENKINDKEGNIIV